MIDGAIDKTTELYYEDSIKNVDNLINDIFVYWITNDINLAKDNVRLSKLSKKFRKMCIKYIDKYFFIKYKYKN